MAEVFVSDESIVALCERIGVQRFRPSHVREDGSYLVCLESGWGLYSLIQNDFLIPPVQDQIEEITIWQEDDDGLVVISRHYKITTDDLCGVYDSSVDTFVLPMQYSEIKKLEYASLSNNRCRNPLASNEYQIGDYVYIVGVGDKVGVYCLETKEFLVPMLYKEVDLIPGSSKMEFAVRDDDRYCVYDVETQTTAFFPFEVYVTEKLSDGYYAVTSKYKNPDKTDWWDCSELSGVYSTETLSLVVPTDFDSVGYLTSDRFVVSKSIATNGGDSVVGCLGVFAVDTQTLVVPTVYTRMNVCDRFYTTGHYFAEVYLKDSEDPIVLCLQTGKKVMPGTVRGLSSVLNDDWIVVHDDFSVNKGIFSTKSWELKTPLMSCDLEPVTENLCRMKRYRPLRAALVRYPTAETVMEVMYQLRVKVTEQS